MIPEQTIEALRMGFGHLGSASSDLKCAHIDTLSTSLEKDKDTITCFVISSLSEKVLENFKSTGRVSFFVGLPSHEAYQFKGEFISTRSLTDEELSHSEKFRNNCLEFLSSMGTPAEAAGKIFGNPADLGLTFKVEQIYKQTPGPEAGKELLFNQA